MQTIRALLVLLGCLALGETAAYLTGIKLPGSIIGMGILFAMLQARWVKAEWLQQLTDALMANLTLNLRSQCLPQSSDRVYQLDDLLLLPAACRQLHLVQQQQRLGQIPQGHLCQAPSLA